jgi:hypothetical protein
VSDQAPRYIVMQTRHDADAFLHRVLKETEKQVHFSIYPSDVYGGWTEGVTRTTTIFEGVIDEDDGKPRDQRAYGVIDKAAYLLSARRYGWARYRTTREKDTRVWLSVEEYETWRSKLKNPRPTAQERHAEREAFAEQLGLKIRSTPDALKPVSTEDLHLLKEKMIAAHPDKGGTPDAFVAAHREYDRARRCARKI